MDLVPRSVQPDRATKPDGFRIGLPKIVFALARPAFDCLKDTFSSVHSPTHLVMRLQVEIEHAILQLRGPVNDLFGVPESCFPWRVRSNIPPPCESSLLGENLAFQDRPRRTAKSVPLHPEPPFRRRRLSRDRDPNEAHGQSSVPSDESSILSIRIRNHRAPNSCSYVMLRSNRFQSGTRPIILVY